MPMYWIRNSFSS